MKKTLLFLFIFCNVLTSAQAQDYYPLRPNDTTYYSPSDASVFLALKIDSSKTKNGESTHYLFKHVRNYDVNKMPREGVGPSWLGDTIHVSKDGWVTFVNRENKPIRVHYAAALGESWLAYEGNDWSANAKMTSFSTETFVGLRDSVKTITFDIRKNDGSDTIHPYDNLSLKLSKDHGIVQIINFYIWDAPLPENWTVRKFKEDKEILQLSLVGMENDKLGMRSLGSDELMRYEVGDTWDVQRIYMRTPCAVETYVYDYERYLVIAKDTSLKPTVYHIQMIRRGLFTPFTDTLVVKAPLRPSINGIPNSYSFHILRIEKRHGRRIKTSIMPMLGENVGPAKDLGKTMALAKNIV